MRADGRTGPYAKGLYEKVLSQFGTKAQLWEAARNGQSNGHAAANGQNGVRAQAPQPDAPRCPQHERPMRYRKGRYGAFWSCPTRLADGSWCAYTQQVPQPANGQKTQSVSA